MCDPDYKLVAAGYVNRNDEDDDDKDDDDDDEMVSYIDCWLG